MKVKSDLKHLVESIKKIREEKGLSKTDLAQKAFNAKGNYITQIENDLIDFKKFTFENFYLLCNALDINPRFLLKKISKTRSKGFLHVKGKDSRLERSTQKSPAPVYRNGQVLGDDVSYYSLLDVVGDEQDIVTDFQIVLAYWEKNSESKRHFQWGEEFLMVLNGKISYTFLDENTKGTISPELWTKNHSLGGVKDSNNNNNYLFLKAWYPHQATAGENGAESIIVTLDPRGESGLMNYDENKDEGLIIKDEDKLSSQNLLRGLGVKIKMSRLRSGNSSTEIAKRVGITSADLYKIENNLVNPKMATVLLLGKHLDIDLFDLFPNFEPPFKKGNYNLEIISPLTEPFKKVYNCLHFSNFLDFNKNVKKNSSIKNRGLNIFKVTPLNDSTEPVKDHSWGFDFAFIVISGFFQFSICVDVEENEYSSVILSELDTIYVKKNHIHYIQPMNENGKFKCEGMFIYRQRM